MRILRIISQAERTPYNINKKHKSLRRKLLVLYGPTAIGKSALAIEIADRINGVILSADSLHLYRLLDIGTAKPTIEQRSVVPHHMIDILDPDEEYTAAMYREHAKGIISAIPHDRNIIVTGGTFLYIRALLCGIANSIGPDDDLRKELQSQIKNHGTERLHKRLKETDPEAASRIHPNDHVRIIRALEVYHKTGRKISDIQTEHEFSEDCYNSLGITLFCERQELYRNIDKRVQRMYKSGLVEEVEHIREAGYGPELKPMQSIGYKQINDYIDNRISIDDALYLIKRDTRHFAKRQLTWLRKEPGNEWVNIHDARSRVYDRAMYFFDSNPGI